MSFLNASTEVKTTTILKPHITKTQLLALLHNPSAMLSLNPIIKSHTPLPASSSTVFFSRVAPENKPPATGPEVTIPVYAIVESSTPETAEGGGTWRGGWAKKFIPEEIHYETSMQPTSDGMVTITHAPMGVHSVTKWKVKDGKEGEGLVLEKTGKVTSNRMLMGFIKTTIQGSYEKLANDFVVELERMVEEERVKKEEAKQEEVKEEKVPVNVEGNEVKVEAVA